MIMDGRFIIIEMNFPQNLILSYLSLINTSADFLFFFPLPDAKARSTGF